LDVMRGLVRRLLEMAEGSPNGFELVGEVRLSGVGLHTGVRCEVRISPAGAGEGVIFVLGGRELPMRWGSYGLRVHRGVSLVFAEGSVMTVEHLLACFNALGVRDAVVELSAEELPIGDGSAIWICEALMGGALRPREVPLEPLSLPGPVWVREGDAVVAALPADGFRVTYVVDYPGTVVGCQAVSLELNLKSFLAGVAPARTFAFSQEVDDLARMGLARGGGLESALVLGEFGPINPEGMRFPDEPARHKVLDLLGDLFHVGAPLRGHFLAYRAGHRLHLALAKGIREVLGLV